MKTLKIILIIALSISFLNLNSQEKKIQFNKGTLKICSSKNFTITGYDGKEVVIKSLHGKNNSSRLRYRVNNRTAPRNITQTQGTTISRSSNNSFSFSHSNDSVKKGRVHFFNNDRNRKEGLKN